MAINGFHQSSMVLAERPMLLKLSLMEEHSLLVTFHIIYEPTSLPLEKIEYVQYCAKSEDNFQNVPLILYKFTFFQTIIMKSLLIQY